MGGSNPPIVTRFRAYNIMPVNPDCRSVRSAHDIGHISPLKHGDIIYVVAYGYRVEDGTRGTLFPDYADDIIHRFSF